MKKIAIIGAGASGIVAAINASKNNKVILIDGNDKCGKKILLTGNGRCNYWNEDVCVKHYQSDDEEILNEILSDKNKAEVFEFLNDLGIYPKVKNGYYYPYSNQAASVREILSKEVNNENIELKLGFKAKEIFKNGEKFVVILEDGAKIEVDKLVIATGSKAYPKTGSDGSGYEFAKMLGHKINDVTPSLVSLISNDKFFKEVENVRCDARVSLYINNQQIKEDVGELQITKYGVSGICIFNVSGLASKNLSLGNKVSIKINFMPFLENGFYAWFCDREKRIKNKTLEEQLESLFNYKLLFALLKKAGLKKEDKWPLMSEKEKITLCKCVENFEVTIEETENFDKSQVCTGGVSLKEINPLTMESKIVPNLYIVGEVLDVDGECGGFNLAFAWITGYLAGRGA